MIIHQIWHDFSSDGSGKDVPKKYKKYVNSWIKHNPGLEYKLWDKESTRVFIKKKFPWFYKYYVSYPYDIQRIDVARCFILYEYGGVYADIDFECLRSFEPVIKEISDKGSSTVINTHPVKSESKSCDYLYFVESPNNYLGKDVILSNALIVSSRKHPFWRKIFTRFIQKQDNSAWFNTRHTYIMTSTGPSLISSIFEEYIDHVRRGSLGILPHEQFNPIGICDKCPSSSGGLALKGKRYSIHRNGGTWESFDSTVIKFIYCNQLVIFVTLILIILVILYLRRK